MDQIEFARRALAATACAIVALILVAAPIRAGKRDERVPPVITVRVPNGGIQPQISIDDRGVLHMVYFSGEAAHGDLYYTDSGDRGTTFAVPLRVNGHDAALCWISPGKSGVTSAGWITPNADL